MEMTHYMELLASNQPWNLFLFMAIPVILAETIAIAELYLLYTRNFEGSAAKISRYAGIMAGIYFTESSRISSSTRSFRSLRAASGGRSSM